MAHGTQRRNARRRYGGTNIPKVAPTALLVKLDGRHDPIVRQAADQVPERVEGEES